METKHLLLTEKEKVRKKWGKTESDVEEYIGILKEWLKTQKHLPEIPVDNTIEYLLTNCKYSIEKTKQTLDAYYSIRKLIPEFFINPLKTDLNLIAKMGYLTPLPKLTDSLCRVTILKYNKEGTDIFDPNEMIGYGNYVYDIRLQEDLVFGEILILDEEHLSMSHVIKLNPTVLKKFVVLIEKFMGNRLKEVHLINCPPYIDKLLSIAKVLMKKKLYDRIHLHPNMESLYKYIPQEMLPSDYGGKEKSLQTLTDLWGLKFKEYEKRFDQLERMEVNEDLRPEPLVNSEVLGYYGNFKKIDVD